MSVPLEFTKDHYAALGRVIVEFQSLEQVVTFALARFMHTNESTPPNFSFLILNELSFANRLKLLNIYINIHPFKHFVHPSDSAINIKRQDYEEEIVKFKEGIRIASDAETKRNQLIHSSWLANPIAGPKESVLRVKVRANSKKVSLAMEYMLVDDINDVAGKMEKAWKLIQLSTTHLFYLLNDKEKYDANFSIRY